MALLRETRVCGASLSARGVVMVDRWQVVLMALAATPLVWALLA
ncbi:MAG: hypothetical protein ACR2HN_03370 [Tepidiformaceae bacterium]